MLGNFTQIDNKGRLRSIVKYECIICKSITNQRIDEVKRRGHYCKKCKLIQNSKNEFKFKNIELTCANVLKSRMNKRYIKRGLKCTLSSQEILELVKSECHYCGIKNSNLHKYKQPNFEYDFYYNGIDRIDSSKGYIQGNVVTCCKTCNVSKMDMGYDEFLKHIIKIYNNLNLCQ